MDKKSQKKRRVKKRTQATKALRAGKVHHQANREWVHDAVISVDREGRIIEFNPAAETIFGHARKDVMGQEMSALIIPPALRERHRAGWERHLATGVTAIIGKRIEITAMRAGGAEFPIELIVTRHGPDRAPTFTAFIRDITERKRAEEALRESESRFRVLYNDNPSMYFTVDVDGTVLSVNRFGMEQLGYRADELVGHSVLTVFHEGDRQKALECLRVAFQVPAQVHQWELRKVRKDGCVLWVREAVQVIQGAAGKPLALVVCEDITARKRAEEERTRLLKEVQDSHERLQHLSRRMLEVQEEERRRIARELHDETGQSLTSLLLGLRMLDEMSTSETAQARVEDLRKIAARALDEVKRLAMGLRPALLDDLGLEAALKRLAEDSGKTPGIFVDLHMNGLNKRRLAFPVATTIYRIVQEALTNAGRHAAAKNVSVLFTCSESSVKLIIEDDGRGFDVEKALRLPGSSNHLGLMGMRERVALLNGIISVESTPGSGTTIYVQLPLEAQPS